MSFSLKWFTQKLAYPEDARTLMQSRVGEPAHQDDRTSGGSLPGKVLAGEQPTRRLLQIGSKLWKRSTANSGKMFVHLAKIHPAVR